MGAEPFSPQLFVTPGLGDNSYLVVSGDEAFMVDPQRDAWRFLEEIKRRGARLRYVLETHVHNDYLTGALELRGETGAEIAISARAGAQYPHLPLEEGQELRVGDLRIAVLPTPGHTDEHAAFVVSHGTEARGVFTGGSLIVGGSGRTDLLGKERARELARKQYRSLKALAALAPDALVLPTHGAGSFCTASAAAMKRMSTVREELARNPMLAARDEDAFVETQLSGLSAYPAYYAHMAAINRAGPRILAGLPRARALTAPELGALKDAWVIDARGRQEFARSHVPGCLNVELDAMFGTYVGWVVPFGSRLALILPERPDALAEALTQLLRIGYDRVEGYLGGGYPSWENAGLESRSYPTETVDSLCAAFGEGRPAVLDVRQRKEWDAGHLEGSRHVMVGDLPSRMSEVPEGREHWVICASGRRASVAASLLDRAGKPVRLVAEEGVPELLSRCPRLPEAQAR